MSDNHNKWALPEFGLGTHAHHTTHKKLKIQTALLAPQSNPASAALHQQGFEKGYAEGLQKAQLEIQQPLQRLQEMVKHLQLESQAIAQEKELAIYTFVKSLCEKVFHKEMTLSQEVIMSVITQALKIIGDSGRDIRILCHPKLHAILQEAKFDSHARVIFESSNQLGDFEFTIESEKQKICFNTAQIINKLFDELLACNSQP